MINSFKDRRFSGQQPIKLLQITDIRTVASQIAVIKILITGISLNSGNIQLVKIIKMVETTAKLGFNPKKVIAVAVINKEYGKTRLHEDLKARFCNLESDDEEYIMKTF